MKYAAAKAKRMSKSFVRVKVLWSWSNRMFTETWSKMPTTTPMIRLWSVSFGGRRKRLHKEPRGVMTAKRARRQKERQKL